MIRKILAVLFAVYVVAGCGGGGTSDHRGSSPEQRTRDAVKAGYARSIMGLAQAGMYGFGTASGGTSGGGGFGFPMVGAFVYQFVPPAGGGAMSPQSAFRARHASFGHRGPEPTDGGGTTGSGTGGTDGGGDAWFYYDDYLGLWVDTVFTETSYVQSLYVDEAKTQAAGSFESTFPTGWDTFPYQYVSSFDITAGNFAGAHGRYETVVEADDRGHSQFESVWPGLGSDVGEFSWTGQGSSWSYESHYGDRWWKGEGTFSDGGGTSEFSDSLGYRTSYTYRSNGSGKGRIDGPDPGLPATITWTPNGHTRIVYADGTVEEWDPWIYFDDGSVGGTTGSSGGETGPG